MKRYGLIFWILVWMLMVGPLTAFAGGGTAFVGRDLLLGPGEQLSGDASVVGGRAELAAGSVLAGNLAAVGADVHIEGTVLGDVVVVGGTAELGAKALVQGDVVVFGTLRRHPSARVQGTIVEGWQARRAIGAMPSFGRGAVWPFPRVSGAPSMAVVVTLYILRTIVAIAALLLVASLAMLLVPEPIGRIASIMESSAPVSLGVGLLTLLVAVIVVPLLVIICIGIPIALALVIGLLMAALTGWVAAGKIVGNRLVAALQVRSAPLAETLLGTFLITLLVRVPFIGVVFGGLIAAWGIGAVVLTRFGTTLDTDWYHSRRRSQLPASEETPSPSESLGEEDEPSTDDARGEGTI